VQLKLCATPRPFSKAKFPSPTACLYIHSTPLTGSRMMPSSGFQTQLQPHVTLIFDFLTSTVHALDLCQFALKSVHSFSKSSVHKLITDGRTNGQTDGRTGRQHYVSNQSRRTNRPTVCVRRRYCFIKMSAFCPR